MGNETLSIPMELFAENRQRLCDRLKAGGNVKPGAVVVLEGGKQTQRYCTDTDVVFRQVKINEWIGLSHHKRFYTSVLRSAKFETKLSHLQCLVVYGNI